MKTVYLRFYEELNDFLPAGKRKIRFAHNFSDSPSVKDLIESQGVPHTEIDMILVNGVSKDFTYNVSEGDEISVYPLFESFDVTNIQHLRPKPLREPKFIMDVHLGSLAKYMRIAGFDSFYRNNMENDEIRNIAAAEKRTILTKDKNILRRNDVTHAYWVRNSTVTEQVEEVIKRFHLENIISPFTRCTRCNVFLEDVSKSEISAVLPDKVKEWHNEFKICPSCGRTYWKGSHFEKMHRFIDNLRKSL